MTNQERIERLEHVRSKILLRGGRPEQRDEDQLQVTLLDEVLDDLRRELRGGLHVLKTPVDVVEEREVALLRLVGELSTEARARLLEHILELEGCPSKGPELLEWSRAIAKRIVGAP